MRLLGVASILAAAGALAMPAPADAIDRVSLQLYPSTVPGKPAWRLTGTAPAWGDGTEEILGVTLARTFRNGTAEETHGLRHSLRQRTFTFDGRNGRWRTQGLLGDVLTVNMTATRSGPEREVPNFLGCRGDYVAVPVLLRGTFVLRTKTRFFGAIRRTQLRGLVTYHREGPVDCTAAPPLTCEESSQLSASNEGFNGISASPSWLNLSFREPLNRAGPVWYHWMSISGFNPFVGALPTLEVRGPTGWPITGGGTFSARETVESIVGGCRRTQIRGAFVGTFQTRFTGWGARTLTVNSGSAEYRAARS